MSIRGIKTMAVASTMLRWHEIGGSRMDEGEGPSLGFSTCVLLSSSTSNTASQSSEIQARVLVSQIDYTKEQIDKV
jgi:hypothetical protein